MGKFKVGDKVKATYSFGTEGAPKKGEVFTVKSIRDKWVGVACPNINDQFYTQEIISGDNANWGEDCFELVSENKLTDQQLLDKLNEGMEAREELLKRNVKLQAFRKNEAWGQFNLDAYCIQKYRIAKKEFKSFTTSNGWFVEVCGNDLHVGCKVFDLKEFKVMLENLTGSGDTAGLFVSTRQGIKYGAHRLSWNDADKILNALNEMEK